MVGPATIVLAHAGAEGGGAATAFTVGIVAMLALAWIGLAALALVFRAAKRREDRRAEQRPADGPEAPGAPTR